MASFDIEATLRSNGYRCRLSQYDAEMLLFEDDAIFGFVVLFDTAPQLLSQWKGRQTTFIQKNAGALRRAHMKSWNCYAIYLSAEPAAEILSPALSDIEEDLALTRKIVADGISTARDVQRALLPILPIQNPSVTTATAASSLGTRLEGWLPPSLRALEGHASAEELLEILWDAS